MSQEPEQQGVIMPRWFDFFLTNRVPCAVMVVLMLTSAYWFNVLFGNIPLLGFLLVLGGMLLHLAVPSVFALVLFGGGLKYSLQVGGIAAALILLLSSGSIYAVLIFFSVFVLIPVSAALTMQRQGISQASLLLAVLVFFAVVLALLIGMDAGGIKAFVSQLFEPMFDNMVTSLPAGETEAVDSVRHLEGWMIQIFPGLLAFSLWLTWWSCIVYARKVAKQYGFYSGDESDVLQLVLPKQLAYVLFAFAVASLITVGDVQYITSNALFVVSGLVAVQGIAVAHTWLKSRGMVNAVVVMYVMLFFWSAVVVIFMLVGLLDFWFNFRRNMVPTTGEK